MNYKKYLNSIHWEKIKSNVYKKRHRCQICGKLFTLNIHHTTYKRLGKELPSDLVVLCQSCHYKAHKDKVVSEGAEWMAKHWNLKPTNPANPISQLLVMYRKAQHTRNFSSVINLIDKIDKSQLAPQDLKQLEVIKKKTNKYRVAIAATTRTEASPVGATILT